MSRVGFLMRVILVATKKGSTLCRRGRKRHRKEEEEDEGTADGDPGARGGRGLQMEVLSPEQ